MSNVTFRFYEELNDFLPQLWKKQDIPVNFKQRSSVKDMIESLGVPHTEIDLILVNGLSVDFSYIVQPQDRISVYPVFESFDISPLNRLRPEPLRKTRFVLDAHLGKLAKYLRMLGFDTLYSNQYLDAELADIASSGAKRILLTRDHGLLKHKRISHGYFVREINPRRQVKEILTRFDLFKSIKAFSRCVHCNGLIIKVEKEQIIEQIPAEARKIFDHFVICEDCRHIYWQGSHYKRMLIFIDTLINCD